MLQRNHKLLDSIKEKKEEEEKENEKEEEEESKTFAKMCYVKHLCDLGILWELITHIRK